MQFEQNEVIGGEKFEGNTGRIIYKSKGVKKVVVAPEGGVCSKIQDLRVLTRKGCDRKKKSKICCSFEIERNHGQP